MGGGRPRVIRVAGALRATPSLRRVPSDEILSTVVFAAARSLGREVQVREAPLPRSISAVWLTMPDLELIEYSSSIPLASTFLGILHEIGHMLCGHGSDPEQRHSPLAALAPSIAPQLSERIVRRSRLPHSALSREEVEAEWYARTMYRRALRVYALERTSPESRAFNLLEAPTFQPGDHRRAHGA